MRPPGCRTPCSASHGCAPRRIRPSSRGPSRCRWTPPCSRKAKWPSPLSPYAMSLRFRTRSCESARLISLHRDPLRAQLEALGPGQRGIDIDLESPP
ncbi:hypothetical protein GO496_19380 [Acidovorax citrulli]|nr:hypothetical protein [Paracidovorax citrulli]